MIGYPPVSVGAEKDTSMYPSPTEVVISVGAYGSVYGYVVIASDLAPEPAIFDAFT